MRFWKCALIDFVTKWNAKSYFIFSFSLNSKKPCLFFTAKTTTSITVTRDVKMSFGLVWTRKVHVLRATFKIEMVASIFRWMYRLIHKSVVYLFDRTCTDGCDDKNRFIASAGGRHVAAINQSVRAAVFFFAEKLWNYLTQKAQQNPLKKGSKKHEQKLSPHRFT